MAKIKSALAGYLLVCAFWPVLGLADSTGAELVNIVIRHSTDDLLVDIKLNGVFTEDMKAALCKGVAMEIAFSVSLYKIRDFWFDNKMISRKATHRVRFDTLKKEYKIRRSWEDHRFKIEKESAVAQSILSQIIGFKVIALNRLKRGSHYQLRVKSELKDPTYLFSGTPWEFETDWYTINFTY